MNNDKIVNAETLYKAAYAQANIIRIRSLLLKHRHLVDITFLEQVTSNEKNDHQPSDYQRMRILYVTACILDYDLFKQLASFAWVAYLFEIGEHKKGKRRSDKVKATMPEPLKDHFEAYFVNADVSYARRQDDHVTALKTAEAALPKAKGEWKERGGIRLLLSMASMARESGQYEKALDHINEVLHIGKTQSENSEEDFDFYLMHLYRLRGLVLEDIGRSDLAHADYQSAYEIGVRLGDIREQSGNLINMAGTFSKRGLMRECVAAFQNVLRIVLDWNDPILIASVENNLATALSGMEKFAEALPHFYNVLRVKYGTNLYSGQAIALQGIARCYQALDDPERAKLYHRLGLGPSTSCDAAIHLSGHAIDHAELYTAPDDRERNLTQLLAAMLFARKKNDLMCQAMLIPPICDLQTSLGRQEQAFWICQSFLDKYPDITTDTWSIFPFFGTYAQLLLDQQLPIKFLWDKLLEILASINRRVDEAIYHKHRAEMVGQSIEVYQVLFKIIQEYKGRETLITGGNKAVFCFDLHEQARSRTLLSDLSLLPLTPSSDIPTELQQREKALLNELRSYLQMENARSEAVRVQRLKELRKELEHCQLQIGVYDSVYARARSGRPYTFEEVKAFLLQESNMAFVSFFCDDEGITVFVVQAGDEEPNIFRMPIGKDGVEAAINQMQRAFNGDPFEFPPYPPILAEHPFERELDLLDQFNLDFLSVLKDVDVLCIAAHGALHQLPFHAMKMNDGRYLAEQYTIVYTASISTTLLLQTHRERKPRTKGESVFVACVPSKEDNRPDLFEKDLSIFDPGSFPRVRSVFGTEASKWRVLEELAGHSILHFSCHGYFDSSSAFTSGLVLSNGYELPSKVGLHRSDSKRENFALTVQDLVGLELDADLVSLNACRTSWQEQRNDGDEWVGFNRTLLLAGASTVLSTMWNVDQASSVQFLNNFYTRWKNVASPVEKWQALSYAQRAYIYSDNPHLRHPYHWAAFTLFGNWH